MKKLVTLKNLTEFTQKEKEIVEAIFDIDQPQPQKTTIQSLLNFSKSLSVRNSKSIGNIEMVLS